MTLVLQVLLNIDVLALKLLHCNVWVHSISPWLSSFDPYYLITSLNHKLQCLVLVLICGILELLEGCFGVIISGGVIFRGCEKSLFHHFFVHYFGDYLGVFKGNIVALSRLIISPRCPDIERCSNTWTQSHLCIYKQVLL